MRSVWCDKTGVERAGLKFSRCNVCYELYRKESNFIDKEKVNGVIPEKAKIFTYDERWELKS